MGSETGSEQQDSSDSDSDSLDSDDERDLPLAYYSSVLPSPPPPPQPPFAINRQRSSTADSLKDGEVPDSTKPHDKLKGKDKKEKHWPWRREEKEKGDKLRYRDKPKEGKKEIGTEYGFNKRMSVRIPHLTSHPSLLGHAPSPVSLLQTFNSTHSAPSHSVLSHENSFSSLHSISSSSSSSFSSSPEGSRSDLINSPTSMSNANQVLSISQSAPTPTSVVSANSSPNTTPPLTPTPTRAHPSNSISKFHAQTLPSNMPPPPTPPKPPVIENDLSNKRSNPGLMVEEDSTGKLTVVAGFVDELESLPFLIVFVFFINIYFDFMHIYCLADRDIPDREFCDIFLCTLTYFTTMEHVLKKLIERYVSL